MSAHHYFRAVFILSLFLPVFTHGQHCSESFLFETRKMNIEHCKKKTLGAEFGWNYFNDTRKLEILFGAKLDGDMGWLAWGLNPGRQQKMVGTRALIGMKLENGTLLYDKYNITRSTKIGCQLLPSEIDLDVRNFSFFSVDTEVAEFYMIHATIILSPEYNVSSINLVWQVGNAVAGKRPIMHSRKLQNFDCKETIDLNSGSVRSVEAHKLQKLRKVHGILNMVGWGTLLPLGVIIARYFKKFPFECSKWFRLHISCQLLGYILGTCGWIIGIWLGNATKYYNFPNHRNLGIIIFTFTTLQMLALRLKPMRDDEYRVYWNMYHHFLGYSLLIIIPVNIFFGIAILSADHAWKWAYIGVLGLLGFTALFLEIFTWIKFLIHRKPGGFSFIQGAAQSTHTQGSTSGSKIASQPSHEQDPGASMGSASQPSAMQKSSSKDVSQPSHGKSSSGLAGQSPAAAMG